MTKDEFRSSNYLERKFYINNTLALKFVDMAKIHKRSESAIVQALQDKIPTLFMKIIESKYMQLDEYERD